MKKQIEALPRVLNRVVALRAVTYEWKNSDRALDQAVQKREIGFIAQEVEQVFPEIVFTDEDGMKSVDYGRIGAILLEAVKEQQQLIKKQSDQIEALEQRIAALENPLRVQQVIS